MGGGDLNLKKSWHPSTMKNIEKVWKAEQQQYQENKKIAELKKELEIEKDREDMKKYAMEQGVIEKKDDKKLDWMYKGPNQLVNREEYLLGRPIDKSFEQLAQAEKGAEVNQTKNHVEHECIPPSLRFFSGNEQVDLVRKMQEDPLYAIKKKEMETRSQLLKNPVKLKQLRQLLEQQSKKSKGEKKQKKKKKHKQDTDSDDEAQLDMLLAAKYKQLKDKISDKHLIKSMKKVHKRKKKSKKKQDVSDESDSDSEVDSSDEDTKKHKRKRSKSAENVEAKKRGREKYEVNRKESNKQRSEKRVRSCDSSNNSVVDRKRNKAHRRDVPRTESKDDFSRYKDRSSHRSKYNEDKYGSSRSRQTEATHSKSFENQNKDRWNPKKKQILTEEEKERRRQEMIANATWRDKERERNVKKYREEEKKEVDSGKVYNQDFVRKQLAVAAEVGTVASRIKANINNIQRSGRAMDTNFAKR